MCERVDLIFLLTPARRVFYPLQRWSATGGDDFGCKLEQRASKIEPLTRAEPLTRVGPSMKIVIGDAVNDQNDLLLKQ